MDTVSLKGVIDLHVHSAPSLFQRIGDDLDVARKNAESGMKAFLVKCHAECTASRAHMVNRTVPNIQVFGGIVLNSFAGGINPAAVEGAIALGAKAIWMPTIDSAFHAKIHGKTGTCGYMNVTDKNEISQHEGITIIDEKGRLKEEVKIIVDMVAKSDLMLETCHLSHEEIFKLVSFAKERKLTKVIITHPFYKVPSFSISQIEELARLGALMEFHATTVFPINQLVSIKEVVKTIKTVGAEHCIIASDSGQPFSPWPDESLRIYAQCLHEEGISLEELEILWIKNPKWLLGI